MCTVCDQKAQRLLSAQTDPDHAARSTESTSARRHFLSRMGALGAMGAVPLATTGLWGQAQAQSRPKPENDLTPDQALTRLMQGNERYVAGQNTQRVDFSSTRAALSQGQNPFACLLSCADSRIAPEYCFDEGRGDLFVTRVAGNFVTSDILASLEYGTVVLKSSLIMVLGHTQCGAINAAVEAYVNNRDYPGHIQLLTTALGPAVRQASQSTPAVMGEDLVLASNKANIIRNVQLLRESNPLLSRKVQEGKLNVVGGLYHLETGRVELLTG